MAELIGFVIMIIGISYTSYEVGKFNMYCKMLSDEEEKIRLRILESIKKIEEVYKKDD